MTNPTFWKRPGNMASLASSRKARVTWRLTVILWLRALLPIHFFVLQSLAFQAADTQPLSAAQVVERMVEMNRYRAEALRSYTSIREYHLELKGLLHKRADMVAKMSFAWPDRKSFTIISESGSEIMRGRVLKALLEAEKESMQAENRQRTALTPENYEFALVGVEGNPRPEFYVLSASPKVKNKFLFKGKVWVDARDFAVARLEGEPAKNPSWWTKKNEITYRYQKLGDFWLPARTETVTDVRLFGRSVLVIDYKDYHLLETRKLQTDVRHEIPAPLSAVEPLASR